MTSLICVNYALREADLRRSCSSGNTVESVECYPGRAAGSPAERTHLLIHNLSKSLSNTGLWEIPECLKIQGFAAGCLSASKQISFRKIYR
jgi:hypothetical protein